MEPEHDAPTEAPAADLDLDAVEAELAAVEEALAELDRDDGSGSVTS